LDYGVRAGVTLDLGDVVSVDLFDRLLGLEEHGHGLAQLPLCLLFDGFDLFCLLVGLSRLCLDIPLYDAGLLFVNCESLQELLCLHTLLNKLRLQFRHLYFEFCDDIVG
jgi:hypothetical protein